MVNCGSWCHQCARCFSKDLTSISCRAQLPAPQDFFKKGVLCAVLILGSLAHLVFRTGRLWFIHFLLPCVIKIENWQEKVRHIVVIPNYKDGCSNKLGTILWQCFVPLMQKAIQGMKTDRTSRIFWVLKLKGCDLQETFWANRSADRRANKVPEYPDAGSKQWTTYGTRISWILVNTHIWQMCLREFGWLSINRNMQLPRNMQLSSNHEGTPFSTPLVCCCHGWVGGVGRGIGILEWFCEFQDFKVWYRLVAVLFVKNHCEYMKPKAGLCKPCQWSPKMKMDGQRLDLPKLGFICITNTVTLYIR